MVLSGYLIAFEHARFVPCEGVVHVEVAAEVLESNLQVARGSRKRGVNCGGRARGCDW